MILRETVYAIVVINTILFLIGFLCFPILLTIQGFVSVIALIILVFWISDLQKELDKTNDTK